MVPSASPATQVEESWSIFFLPKKNMTALQLYFHAGLQWWKPRRFVQFLLQYFSRGFSGFSSMIRGFSSSIPSIFFRKDQKWIFFSSLLEDGEEERLLWDSWLDSQESHGIHSLKDLDDPRSQSFILKKTCSISHLKSLPILGKILLPRRIFTYPTNQSYGIDISCSCEMPYMPA